MSNHVPLSPQRKLGKPGDRSPDFPDFRHRIFVLNQSPSSAPAAALSGRNFVVRERRLIPALSDHKSPVLRKRLGHSRLFALLTRLACIGGHALFRPHCKQRQTIAAWVRDCEHVKLESAIG
jgi:hypothetical protein